MTSIRSCRRSPASPRLISTVTDAGTVHHTITEPVTNVTADQPTWSPRATSTAQASNVTPSTAARRDCRHVNTGPAMALNLQLTGANVRDANGNHCRHSIRNTCRRTSFRRPQIPS